MTPKDTSPATQQNQARKRGSRTAEVVAAARAGHFARGHRPLVVEDPYAIHLAGDGWRRVVSSRFLHWLVTRVLLRKLMPGGVYALVRARFTDDCVVAAVERGIRQLVILGAGFDTFALRHPELPLEVFEVDLAATSALKRERLEAASIPLPERLHLVTTDFERDVLGERLTAAGFDPNTPAFFSWVGVTYYLTREAILATLAQVGGLAAPGSELTLDYLTVRERVAEKDLPLFDSMLRFVKKRGEPMLSSFDPQTVLDQMGLASGWAVRQHVFPADDLAGWLAGRTDVGPVAPLYPLLHLRRR